MVQDKNYPLTHALAYETTMDDAERIVVVLSGQAISAEKLKEARAEEKDGHDASFNRPYLKLVFTKAGETQPFQRRGWHLVHEQGAEWGDRGIKVAGRTGDRQSQPAE